MPWALSFANGFCLGAVSPAILVPSVMILIQLKRGTKKGIPLIMLAAASFDDIVAITMFSLFLSVAFQSINNDKLDSNLESREFKTLHILQLVGNNIMYIAFGIILGGVLGFGLIMFDKCANFKNKLQLYIKFFIMLFIAITMPAFCNHIELEQAKYIAIIFFGYACYLGWDKNKPDGLLSKFWQYCQPFLFSTIGASV